ncbi:MAG TPA: hypothetical protein ENN19_06740 [Chloroflexi bacterium]|nr:hypothetical protein [Chloroflexota bacterium]
MAKKSRRINKPVRLTEAQMVRPEAAQPITSTKSQDTINLAEEYQYVIADLKRIGLIALIMLTALITLSMLLT